MGLDSTSNLTSATRAKLPTETPAVPTKNDTPAPTIGKSAGIAEVRDGSDISRTARTAPQKPVTQTDVVKLRRSMWRSVAVAGLAVAGIAALAAVTMFTAGIPMAATIPGMFGLGIVAGLAAGYAYNQFKAARAAQAAVDARKANPTTTAEKPAPAPTPAPVPATPVKTEPAASPTPAPRPTPPAPPAAEIADLKRDQEDLATPEAKPAVTAAAPEAKPAVTPEAPEAQPAAAPEAPVVPAPEAPKPSRAPRTRAQVEAAVREARHQMAVKESQARESSLRPATAEDFGIAKPAQQSKRYHKNFHQTK